MDAKEYLWGMESVVEGVSSLQVFMGHMRSHAVQAFCLHHALRVIEIFR